MMKRFLQIRSILLCLIVLNVSGCGRRAVVLKYYVIEPIAVMDSLNNKHDYLIDAICEIKPVQIFTAFSSTRIAHRNESHEITYYGFHQWAVTPGIEMTQVLESSLKSKNIFRDVSTRFWKLSPDYFLETVVYQLETIQEKKLSAHLKIDFRLIKAINNEEVLLHSVDRVEQLAQNNMNLFAAAISKIYNEEIHNLYLKVKNDLAIQ